MLKTPRTLPERFNTPNPPYTKTRRNARHAGPDAPIGPCTSRITQRAEIPRRGGPQSRPPKPSPLRGGRWHGEAVADEGAFFRQSDSIARAGLEITPAAHRRPGTGGRGQAPPPTQRQGEARTQQGPMPASGRILTDGGRTVCVPAQGPGPRRPLGLVGKDFDLQFLADPKENIQRWGLSPTFNLIHKRLRNPHRFRQLILTQSQLYSLFSNHFFIVLQNPSP